MRAAAGAGAGPFVLAEGPLWWPDGTLSWVDVTAGELHVARPRGGRPEPAAGPTATRARRDSEPEDLQTIALYRIQPPLGGAVTQVLSGLTASNGLGWSPGHRTMYVTAGAGLFTLSTSGERPARHPVSGTRPKHTGRAPAVPRGCR